MNVYPNEICFNITRRCNLHCEYCYVSDFINKENNNLKLDLPLNKIKSIVKQSSIKSVYLTGGEPFMHPEIREIISYFTNLDIKINIATNALLITENMCHFLNNKNITLLISLREVYDFTFHVIKMIEQYNIDIVCYHIPKDDSPSLLYKLMEECPSVKKVKLLYDSKNPKFPKEWFGLLNNIYKKLESRFDNLYIDVEVAFVPKSNIIAKDERRGAFDRVQVSTEGFFYYCPLLVNKVKGATSMQINKCNPKICPILSKKMDNEKYASVCCFLVSSLRNAILIGRYGGAIK